MVNLTDRVLQHRYHIRSLLGQKTGRRTFLATDLQSKSSVAIKLLLFGPDFTWDDLKLFERESETLKFLDHAAIPKYLDCFEADTELGKGSALVQSYIEARSLQDWIQAGRTFSEADLKAIAESLLGVLAYLHRRQPSVIHRDIKPSNILLGDRSGNTPGKIYLIDFGSVQTTIAAEDGSFTVVGTYGYMPPEQFGGRTVPASDLYSLGATLIYLMTGLHPAQLLRDDLQIDFKAETQVSHSFQLWLKRLVEPSLKQRFSCTEEALKSLQQPAALLSFDPPSRYSKFLVTRTTGTFHWVVPRVSKWSKLMMWYDYGGSLGLKLFFSSFSITLLFFCVYFCTTVAYGIFNCIASGNVLGATIQIAFVYLLLNAGVLSFNEIAEFLADTHFKVDKERIQMIHYLFGIRWHSLNCSPKDFRLRLIPRRFVSNGTDDNGKSLTKEVQTKLEFWANHKKHHIPQTQYFNELELEWFAQELSTVLDQPLETIAIEDGTGC